ncbi:hypothetical protein SAMN04487980_1002336 [Streptomyces sp. cf124]|nr:hypothetical protein SAMN04487980_1002336 [Streptomyces sp. cf124]
MERHRRDVNRYVRTYQQSVPNEIEARIQPPGERRPPLWWSSRGRPLCVFSFRRLGQSFQRRRVVAVLGSRPGTLAGVLDRPHRPGAPGRCGCVCRDRALGRRRQVGRSWRVARVFTRGAVPTRISPVDDGCRVGVVFGHAVPVEEQVGDQADGEEERRPPSTREQASRVRRGPGRAGPCRCTEVHHRPVLSAVPWTNADPWAEPHSPQLLSRLPRTRRAGHRCCRAARRRRCSAGSATGAASNSFWVYGC